VFQTLLSEARIFNDEPDNTDFLYTTVESEKSFNPPNPCFKLYCQKHRFTMMTQMTRIFYPWL